MVGVAYSPKEITKQNVKVEPPNLDFLHKKYEKY
jgi:hypothetical protein